MLNEKNPPTIISAPKPASAPCPGSMGKVGDGVAFGRAKRGVTSEPEPIEVSIVGVAMSGARMTSCGRVGELGATATLVAGARVAGGRVAVAVAVGGTGVAVGGSGAAVGRV